MLQSPDYQSLIDDETWRFIRRTEGWYPPDAVNLPIDGQRHLYDAMCRDFLQSRPSDVSSSDELSGTLRTRQYVYTAEHRGQLQAQIVYLHGGGFVVGGLHSHDDVCAELCQATGFAVSSVDYRLCPEHRHPAAFEDAITAVRSTWHRCPVPILLCGDSAGATLAAAAAHHLRGDAVEIAGQVLIYPGLGGDTTQGSYLLHAGAPLLTTADVDYYASIRTGIRTGAPATSEDPTLAPLCDTDFSRLPPTVVFTAECDPLSDDGRHYRDRILAAGGKAVWINETGLVHGYLRARTTVKRAEASFRRIVEALCSLGAARWPYQD